MNICPVKTSPRTTIETLATLLFDGMFGHWRREKAIILRAITSVNNQELQPERSKQLSFVWWLGLRSFSSDLVICWGGIIPIGWAAQQLRPQSLR